MSKFLEQKIIATEQSIMSTETEDIMVQPKLLSENEIIKKEMPKISGNMFILFSYVLAIFVLLFMMFLSMSYLTFPIQ